MRYYNLARGLTVLTGFDDLDLISSPCGLFFQVVEMLRFMSCDINQPSLPTPFILFLVSVSASMALSFMFRSANSSKTSKENRG